MMRNCRTVCGLAGYRKPEDADTFLSLKLLCSYRWNTARYLRRAKDMLLYALFLGVAGFFVPDMLLFYAISKRKTKIGMALPDAMDLLVICMEAGLGIDQAVRQNRRRNRRCPPGTE